MAYTLGCHAMFKYHHTDAPTVEQDGFTANAVAMQSPELNLILSPCDAMITNPTPATIGPCTAAPKASEQGEKKNSND